MKHGNRGLTLIELLVIVLIILTLILVATPPLLSARLRAEIARVQQDMQVVESALEWYYLDYKRYPESGGSDLLSTNGARASTNRAGKGLLRLSENEYLETLPRDQFVDARKASNTSTIFQFGSSGRPPGSSSARPVPAWILVSPGPDRITDTQSIADFPFTTIAWQYDPTNGLKSEGDILRLGGDWQLGDWYLDGQRIRAPESGE